MKSKIAAVFSAVVLTLSLSGCAVTDTDNTPSDNTSEESVINYQQISQDEAAEMMQKDDGHIILDVRRPDEFSEGHIPDAICIPNESIADSMPEQLPDKDAVILVYCRSGNRSKQAAQKLADMGYTNVYEFGGILSWQGEITTE